jgi:hypothetical protein
MVRPSALAYLQVDHQLVLGWCLHRQITRLLAFENTINLAGRPSELIEVDAAVVRA